MWLTGIAMDTLPRSPVHGTEPVVCSYSDEAYLSTANK